MWCGTLATTRFGWGRWRRRWPGRESGLAGAETSSVPTSRSQEICHWRARATGQQGFQRGAKYDYERAPSRASQDQDGETADFSQPGGEEAEAGPSSLQSVPSPTLRGDFRHEVPGHQRRVPGAALRAAHRRRGLRGSPELRDAAGGRCRWSWATPTSARPTTCWAA